MIAVLGGLLASILWSAANVGSTRAGHHVGVASTVAWSTTLGLLVALPLAAASGPIPPFSPADLGALGLAAVGGVGGLPFAYRALRMGKIGLISALISTEGAIAATLAILAGEQLRPVVAATLVVIVIGVVVLAIAGGEVEEQHHPDRRLDPDEARRAVMYAAAAAILFGIGLFGAAHLADTFPPVYATLPSRVGGFVFVFLPLLATGRLRLTRPAVPWVVLVAAADVTGILAFAVGARDNAAVAAVLASQVAAISTVGAFLLYRERLSPRQWMGLGAVAVGVAVLSLARA